MKILTPIETKCEFRKDTLERIVNKGFKLIKVDYYLNRIYANRNLRIVYNPRTDRIIRNYEVERK